VRMVNSHSKDIYHQYPNKKERKVKVGEYLPFLWGR
jgi:hypothetical protein